MDEGARTGGLVEAATKELEAMEEGEGVRWEPLEVDMEEEGMAWALEAALHGEVGHLLASSMEVLVRAMGRTLLRHMGAMEGDTEVAPVVLEVETRGAMEEDATTEGIEGESEKTQICHTLICHYSRVLLEQNICCM